MIPRRENQQCSPEPDDQPGCRSVNRALARDLVKRNVVGLCTVPQGCAGRRSKALTVAQAEGVLRTAEGTRMHSYIVLSLLTGARTEELRALTWDAVDLIGDPEANVPVPPHVAVWRSTRAGGDTRTANPGARFPCLSGASQPSNCSAPYRNATVRRLALAGASTGSSSPQRSALRLIRRMSGVSSEGPSGASLGSILPTGVRASYGTASSRCCRTTGHRSMRLPGLSGIAVRR